MGSFSNMPYSNNKNVLNGLLALNVPVTLLVNFVLQKWVIIAGIQKDYWWAAAAMQQSTTVITAAEICWHPIAGCQHKHR
jgi:hypothetical protein